MDTDLFRRADTLVENACADGRRRMLGITGAPGAGKSTVAGALTQALRGAAVCVGMDGFHLAQAELDRLGRAERKGAPDTFDGHGYLALLRRLRAAEEPVYAPEFRRAIEEPVAGAVPVPPDVPLIITEGNYLLLSEEPWAQVREVLDEVWFLDPPEDLRVDRLISRHRAYGRTPEQAAERALGPDAHNAELIAMTSWRADLVVATAPAR